MKVNPLLDNIIRGEWLLDVNYVYGAAPMIQNFLAGKPLQLPGNDEPKAILTIVDENGSAIKSENNGTISVPEGSIAVVSMVGAIIKYGDYCTYGADEIVAALQKADSNANVKAIILKIDGPGGSVNAIGPFIEFSKTKTKPIIGLADACMSLHYWTAVCVCDHLLADNDVSARFGSVGVVSSFVDAQPLWEEAGYVFHEIYPEESEHKNLAFREALKGNYDKIKKEHLSPIAVKFQDYVKLNRTNLIEEKGVLTGATFSADKALGLKMIDGIGGMKEAVQMANIKAEITSMNNY